MALFSLTQTTSNLVQKHVVWSYRPEQNFGQIDHNLHNQDFDDVIRKPLIEAQLSKCLKFEAVQGDETDQRI